MENFMYDSMFFDYPGGVYASNPLLMEYFVPTQMNDAFLPFDTTLDDFYFNFDKTSMFSYDPYAFLNDDNMYMDSTLNNSGICDFNSSMLPEDTPSAPMTDMFGNPVVGNPMDVDIMSGLPCSAFDHSMADAMHEMRVEKLEHNDEIETQRDIAVKKYQDAKQSGNVEDMLKWESVANEKQGELYSLWNTPTYGLDPKAPGID